MFIVSFSFGNVRTLNNLFVLKRLLLIGQLILRKHIVHNVENERCSHSLKGYEYFVFTFHYKRTKFNERITNGFGHTYLKAAIHRIAFVGVVSSEVLSLASRRPSAIIAYYTPHWRACQAKSLFVHSSRALYVWIASCSWLHAPFWKFPVKIRESAVGAVSISLVSAVVQCELN